MIRYCPPLSVSAVRTFSISTGLEASTVTPGRTAPDESRTTPAMDACAYAATGVSNPVTSRHNANRKDCFILPPPPSSLFSTVTTADDQTELHDRDAPSRPRRFPTNKKLILVR